MTKTNTPQLRFPEFTDEWQEKKLGNVIDVVMGQSPSSKDYNDIKIGDYLIQGNADIVDRATSPRFWTKTSTKICNIDDIILTVRAPSGYVAKSKHKACIGRGVCAIKHNNKSIHNFIYQFLLYFEPKWKNIEQGSTFTAISGDDIRSLKINIPSLPEQQKIAVFLGKVDERIGGLEKKKELFSEYKKSVMQKIFNQEIRFKDENGKQYPDWKEKKLGEILFEPKKEKELNPDIIELLTVKLHCLGITKTNNFPKSTKGGRPYYRRYKDELLIGRQNFHNGGFGFVNNQTNGLIASNAISSFLFKNNVDKNFIYFSLSRKDFYKKVGHIIGGTGQKEISSREFIKLKIKTPILEEQQKIAEFLTLLDNKIDQINDKLTQAKLFKKSLLQKMFI